MLLLTVPGVRVPETAHGELACPIKNMSSRLLCVCVCGGGALSKRVGCEGVKEAKELNFFQLCP